MPMTPTTTGVYKEITNYIKKYKEDKQLLDVAFFPGFPFADVEDSRASVFVTAEHAAEEHADFIAKYIWKQREKLVVLDTTGTDEAVELANKYLAKESRGFVVINEASDNPGCGAPGDSTFLLNSMLKANIEGSAFAYIYDPESVEKAKKAGVGDKADLMLGGKIEDAKYHGNPIDIKEAVVCSISDGVHISTTPLMKSIPGSFGDTVRVQVGNVEIVIASVQNQTYDDRAFFAGGIDINQKKLLGLKSAQHFKAFFENKALLIIPSNPKGIATSNLNLLDYVNIKRPIYPLDDETIYK